jgi:MBOAT, membrane-bound O-acyltransferase family
MEGAARLLLAIATAWGCGTAAGIIRFRSRGRSASWCLVPVVLACPLLIPSEDVALRAAAACVSGDLAFKMVDFFRQRRRDGPALREYVRFLVPCPVFAVVYPDHRRRLSRPDRPWPHALRIVGGLAGVAAGVLLAAAKRGVAPFRSSFPLDHAAMLVTFVLTIESLSQVLYGLERLAGYDVSPIIRRAFLARSVSEFWRRYNGRVHDWLHRHVFRVSGGGRHPARGTVLVFLVSGLFHELMFDVATAKITGYQLAFFLIQAPPALASRRLERLARRRGIAGRVVAHGLTILFLSAASVLFFRGVSDIFPFIYASRPPLP